MKLATVDTVWVQDLRERSSAKTAERSDSADWTSTTTFHRAPGSPS
jgi:hypothetical protein